MSFWHRAGGNAVCAYQIESFLHSDPVRNQVLARSSLLFLKRILEKQVNLLTLVSSFVWITGTSSAGEIQCGRRNISRRAGMHFFTNFEKLPENSLKSMLI